MNLRRKLCSFCTCLFIGLFLPLQTAAEGNGLRIDLGRPLKLAAINPPPGFSEKLYRINQGRLVFDQTKTWHSLIDADVIVSFLNNKSEVDSLSPLARAVLESRIQEDSESEIQEILGVQATVNGKKMYFSYFFVENISHPTERLSCISAVIVFRQMTSLLGDIGESIAEFCDR